MPIYDKSTRELFFDMAAELLPDEDSTIDRADITQWFQSRYPKIKKATVTAHIRQMSTNAPSRVHHNVGPNHDLLYQLDERRFRRFRSGHDPEPIYADSDVGGDEIGDDESTEEPREFAYERDLKNFLSKNLHIIEADLTLYQDEDGITGIEFPVGGRFIDILAIDGSGALVVIELKVSKGYDRVIGQLLRYIGWIERNLAENKKVRGVIVASAITEDLKLACSRLQGVKLFEYELAVKLKEVMP